MHRIGEEPEKEGHKSYYIPCGGSNTLGSIGYANAVKELSEQIRDVTTDEGEKLKIDAVVSATGSGGTTAGLLLGTRLYLPEAKLFGIAVDTDPFEEIVPEIACQGAALMETSLEELDCGEHLPDYFEMFHHWGAGYAIPGAQDTPYIHELARMEGILLDPVYTGKAWAGFLEKLKEGYFDSFENIVFVHTGGAAALFAMRLPEE